MRQFILGLLCGIVLLVGGGFLLIVAMAALGGGGPTVADDSILHLRLGGGIPEFSQPDPFAPVFDPEHVDVNVFTLTSAIRRAGEDERISALALDMRGIGIGWAKMQELRWAIEAFRESGKPVYAFMQYGSSMDYLIAGTAEKVYLEPEGQLDMRGLRAEVAFYKDTFEKIGVEAQMEYIGKYKSAGEPYSRSSMSEAFREVIDSILDEIYGQFTETIAGDRDKDVEEVKAILDEGPFIASEALEFGLVDELAYRDEFWAALEETVDAEEPERIGLKKYLAAGYDDAELGGDEQIALVYGVGTILRGSVDQDPFGGGNILAGDSFSETLARVRKNDDIDAVVVRIDSPGGDAMASDQMWREMNLLAEEKPVVISMSDVAASGGYYIAMAGEKAPIFAYEGTTTGSIGVVFGKFNLRGLYDKIGLNKEIVKRGRYSDIYSDYRSLDEAELQKLRDGIEAVYKAFVTKVADSRGREYEAIHEVAQGRVWMGRQAKERGLVDELGGFEAVFRRAKEMAGLDPDKKYALRTYPARRTVWEQLLEGGFGGLRLQHPGLREDPVQRWMREQVDGLGPWQAMLEGGTLAISPYQVRIR